MDQQNWILIGGITVAVAISIYLLWGPSPFPKKRSGEVVGLVNLGSTCFLNTLLQALASCALFVEWLDQQLDDDKPFTTALQHVLWVLNGRGNEEVFSPVKLLSLLRQKGWVLPPGEQDAHELFHCIIATLQGENTNKKLVSISDALSANDTPTPQTPVSDTCDSIDDPFEMVKMGDANGDRTAPDSLTLSTYDDACKGDSDSLSLPCQEFYSVSSGDETLKHFATESNLNKPEMERLRVSQESIRRGLFSRSGTSPSTSLPTDFSPFQGLLASSLQCRGCGTTSCVRTDTFDSVSLTWGDKLTPRLKHTTLDDLLKLFVRTEIVEDVDCEKCSKRVRALKSCNFGKLPPCLCIHLSRTAWHTESATLSKKLDYVEFPEYLVLDPYTYTYAQQPTPSKDLTKAKHLYRLKSVVVHVGGPNSGHFMTFRRGCLESDIRHGMLHECLNKLLKHFINTCDTVYVDSNTNFITNLGWKSKNFVGFCAFFPISIAPFLSRRGEKAGAYKDSARWFLASDENVKLSSFLKVRESSAYMLFYERCSFSCQYYFNLVVCQDK